MKKSVAITTYFNQGPDAKVMTTKEMLELRRDDAKGFDEVASLCAKELGVELD